MSTQESQKKRAEGQAQLQTAPSLRLQFDNPQKRKQAQKQQIVQLKLAQKEIPLFSHLPQYEKPSSVSLLVKYSAKYSEPIHPAIANLGLKYAERVITGSNARCVALLDSFHAYITDYEPAPEISFANDLREKMNPLIQFLSDCRPMSIGMLNACKMMKTTVGRTARMPHPEAKEFILTTISDYRQRISVADQLIADQHAAEKIVDGDVILTYGSSYVVQKILTRAHDSGKKISVIIVDANPKFEGKTLLNRLMTHGIPCTYVLLTALSYVIRSPTKCLLGAHGLLSNGSVVGRSGSAAVVMMAHHHHIPVLICSETHKFHERVQLDAITNNELEDADSLLENTPEGYPNLEGWRQKPTLRVLNLAYDVIPIEYVSVIVTEVGLVPPTSVPVILREANQKMEDNQQKEFFELGR